MLPSTQEWAVPRAHEPDVKCKRDVHSPAVQGPMPGVLENSGQLGKRAPSPTQRSGGCAGGQLFTVQGTLQSSAAAQKGGQGVGLLW